MANVLALILDFQPPELGEKYLRFKPPSPWYFCYNSLNQWRQFLTVNSSHSVVRSKNQAVIFFPPPWLHGLSQAPHHSKQVHLIPRPHYLTEGMFNFLSIPTETA